MGALKARTGAPWSGDKGCPFISNAYMLVNTEREHEGWKDYH